MLAVIAATATANSPSTLTTLLTALRGALVGGIITGIATLVVEGRRAEHERDLVDARATHDSELADAGFAREQEALDREESALLQGAARMLDNEFWTTRAIFQVAAHRKESWSEHWVPPRVSADEHRVLARHLDGDKSFLVVMAEGLASAAFASAASPFPHAHLWTRRLRIG